MTKVFVEQPLASPGSANYSIQKMCLNYLFLFISFIFMGKNSKAEVSYRGFQ